MSRAYRHGDHCETALACGDGLGSGHPYLFSHERSPFVLFEARSHKIVGALWGLAAAISIGSSDLFARRVVNVSGPVTAALWYQGAAVITTLIPTVLIGGSPSTADLGWGALSGIGIALGLGTYYRGLVLSSSALVAPVVATLAAVVPYCYSILRGSEVSGLALLGAVMAFAGLAVVTSGASQAVRVADGESPLQNGWKGSGATWALVSGLGYAFSLSVLVEVSDESGMGPAVTQRSAAGLVLLIAALVGKHSLMPKADLRPDALKAGSLGGITSICYLLGLAAYAPAAVVTGSMFPVFSVGVGVMWFGDSFGRRHVIGIAAVVLGTGAVALG